MELKQYSIVLVDLDPTIGDEIQKTRPCVILSPNEMNRFLKTVVIAPMTTNLKACPTRVAVKSNGEKAMIAVDQIRTVDKSWIRKVSNQMTHSEVLKLKEVIKETFVK